jgi:hypothetical protein
MIVSAPETSDLTPDDLVLEPAETEAEVNAAWDWHDGRNAGSMVVGVYRLDAESGVYVRDTRWGILGDTRKTHPASPEDTIGPSMGFIRNDANGSEGDKVIQLGDLLPPAVFAKIEPIMKKIGRNQMDPGEGKRKILELLQPIKEDLLRKGVLDEYLAWVLVGIAQNMWG